MNVIMYSTGCPKCNVLKSKLDSKSIPYVVVSDVSSIIAKGITAVPVLEIDGRLLDFKKAVDWVNER